MYGYHQQYGHYPQYGASLSPKAIKYWLIGFKAFDLVATVAIMVLSAIIPEPLTADHVWNCNDSPENACARLLLVPLFFSVAMILYDIGDLALIALDVVHMTFVIIDGVLALLISVMWFVVFTVLQIFILKFKLRPMTTTSPDERERREYPNKSFWFAAFILCALVASTAFGVAFLRLRQACMGPHLPQGPYPLPVPAPLVTIDGGPMVTKFGPAVPMEPIEPITKEENSGPIKK